MSSTKIFIEATFKTIDLLDAFLEDQAKNHSYGWNYKPSIVGVCKSILLKNGETETDCFEKEAKVFQGVEGVLRVKKITCEQEKHIEDVLGYPCSIWDDEGECDHA